MLKAIQTRYAGCHFRSRLEARWAIAFDTLGLKWEYEREGYDLGVNGWYLPDFWIAYPCGGDGWGEWIEIKPSEPSEAEKGKLAALVEATGHRAYCICGSPWHEEHKVLVFQHHHLGQPKRIPLIDDGVLKEKRIGGAAHYPAEAEIYVNHSGGTKLFCFPHSIDWRVNTPGMLTRAFTAARSARFEHGETPT